MNPELELRVALRHIAALCDMGLMDPGVDVAGQALREKLRQVRVVALAALEETCPFKKVSSSRLRP